MAPASQAPKDTSGARSLPPIIRKSLKSGLITVSAVSENDRPGSSVMESINMHFDKIGTATVRKGLTALGTGTDGSNVLGIHNHIDNVTLNFSQLVAVTGTTVWYLSGSSWTSIRTGLTTGQKARFSSFLNYLFMVNGVDATNVWDGNPGGSGFVNTGNAASAPIGKYIENFRARMWIAGNATYPDRLYYSSVPSSVTTPIVTWNTDVATGTWIDISPSDGDTITGLQRARNVLLVFKTNRLYRVFDVNQLDPDPYYTVGTSSQESIIEAKTGIFFHHSSGFYQYDVYGIVQEVSRPIIDIIKAIPTSMYPNIIGWLDPQGDHICWEVGSVTYGGVSYTNMVVRYTISTQTWTHYEYPNQITASLRRQPLYNDGTTMYALVGDSAGVISKADTGTSDNGTPIQVMLTHGWDLIDTLLSTRKIVQTANFGHYQGASMEVAYQTEANDPDALLDWTKRVGQLGNANTGFNTMGIKGRKIRFRIAGSSNGQPFQYQGYELLDVINEYLQFPRTP